MRLRIREWKIRLGLRLRLRPVIERRRNRSVFLGYFLFIFPIICFGDFFTSLTGSHLRCSVSDKRCLAGWCGCGCERFPETAGQSWRGRMSGVSAEQRSRAPSAKFPNCTFNSALHFVYLVWIVVTRRRLSLTHFWFLVRKLRIGPRQVALAKTTIESKRQKNPNFPISKQQHLSYTPLNRFSTAVTSSF